MSKHRLYAERYANGLLIGKHGHTEMVLSPEDEDTLRAALRSDSPEGRSEPNKAVFYEVGYRDGYFAGQAGRPSDPSVPDSMVPVEVSESYCIDDPEETFLQIIEASDRAIPLGPGYLLPRPQVEGDE